MSGKKQTHCRKGHEFTEKSVYKGNNGRTCKICYAKRKKEWRENNLEKVRVSRSNSTRKKNGWTPEAVEKALEKQGNCCALCSKKFLTSKGKTGPQADHKHTVPPQPRGMLCANCNCGLGNFFEDPQLLTKAIEYLAKF